jgi:hypothetical protein
MVVTSFGGRMPNSCHVWDLVEAYSVGLMMMYKSARLMPITSISRDMPNVWGTFWSIMVSSVLSNISMALEWPRIREFGNRVIRIKYSVCVCKLSLTLRLCDYTDAVDSVNLVGGYVAIRTSLNSLTFSRCRHLSASVYCTTNSSFLAMYIRRVRNIYVALVLMSVVSLTAHVLTCLVQLHILASSYV